MNRRLVLLALLGAASAHAGSIEYTMYGGTPVAGFSPDGLFFVFGSTNDGASLDECVIVNTRTARSDVIDGTACAAFRKKQQVQPVKSSRTSPDGKAKAEVQLVKQSEGAWKGNVYTPGATSGAQLLIDRDGKKTLSAEWRSGLISLDAYWSPDGHKVAWVGRTSRYGGMDGSFVLTLMTSTTGPRVRVVADPALLGKPAEAAAVALEAKGLGPGFIGKALKARPASVVYFADGYEEVAKEAASVVPGGATTEKLTWPAAAELVVALGKTAAGGKP